MQYSKILKQNITVNDNSVTCEDGTIYSRAEMQLIKDLTDEEKFKLHKVKKIFRGEICPPGMKKL